MRIINLTLSLKVMSPLGRVITDLTLILFFFLIAGKMVIWLALGLVVVVGAVLGLEEWEGHYRIKQGKRFWEK